MILRSVAGDLEVQLVAQDPAVFEKFDIVYGERGSAHMLSLSWAQAFLMHCQLNVQCRRSAELFMQSTICCVWWN